MARMTLNYDVMVHVVSGGKGNEWPAGSTGTFLPYMLSRCIGCNLMCDTPK